jgi:hypothetical protein
MPVLAGHIIAMKGSPRHMMGLWGSKEVKVGA